MVGPPGPVPVAGLGLALNVWRRSNRVGAVLLLAVVIAPAAAAEPASLSTRALTWSFPFTADSSADLSRRAGAAWSSDFVIVVVVIVVAGGSSWRGAWLTATIAN